MRNGTNPFQPTGKTLRPGAVTCQVHLVWPDRKPCSDISKHTSTAGNTPILLCEFHLWTLGLKAKKKPPKQREQVVIIEKVRRTRQRVSDKAEYEKTINQLQQTIDEQRRQIDELTQQKQRGPRNPDEMGTIYYLRVGGYYKIGWASDLEKRMRNYYPDTQLLAAHAGTRADEKRLHKRWSHLLAFGNEWFTLAPEIGRHIDQMIEKHGEPEQVRFSAAPKKQTPMPHRLNTTGPRPKGWAG